jgi:hypothetical protein
MPGTLLLANGSSSTPTLTFTSDTSQGLYRIGSTSLGLRVSSTRGYEFGTTALAPQNNNVQDIGTTAVRFKDLWLDGLISNVKSKLNRIEVAASGSINLTAANSGSIVLLNEAATATLPANETANGSLFFIFVSIGSDTFINANGSQTFRNDPAGLITNLNAIYAAGVDSILVCVLSRNNALNVIANVGWDTQP